MTNTEREELNRFIHETVLSKCWHTAAIIRQDADGRFWKCVKCDIYFGKYWDAPASSPDYTTDLNAVHKAEEKVIELKGMDTYGRSLTEVGFETGILSDIDHGQFLVMAPALDRAKAVKLAWEAKQND